MSWVTNYNHMLYLIVNLQLIKFTMIKRGAQQHKTITMISCIGVGL